MNVSRRKFLGLVAAAGGATAIGLLGRGSSRSSAALGSDQSVVVARRNGSVDQMVGEVVDYLGGMGSFVHPGVRVAVKVNGSWDNPMANTGAGVVRAVVSLARQAGASEVVVYDHIIHDGGWPSIASAAESAGGVAVKLGRSAGDYVDESVGGVGLKSAKIAKVLYQSDVLINAPVLKTHSAAQVTIGLKNHLGSILDRDAVHDGGGHGLHQGIADINTSPSIRSKHRLTIVDAIHPMVTGGPSAGSYADYNGIIAGRDPVATDYIGTRIIRRYNPSVPKNPTHIQRAADLGLGTNDPDRITFGERDVYGVPEAGVFASALVAGGLSVLAARDRSSASTRRHT